MSRAEFMPSAKADLDEIWEYIAEDNVEAANRFIDRLVELAENLALQPSMGRSRAEFSPRLRSIPYGRFMVFYQPAGKGIEIIRVLAAARDINQTFFL
jgi:toxin ParE1/3/4